MSLYFALRATTTRHTSVMLGLVEIRRHEHLDLADPASADAVSTYTVRIDGREMATVRHRYGDGAWPLVRTALVAAFPAMADEDAAAGPPL